MLSPAANTLLAPVAAIDGFRLASLVDAATGMVVSASVHDPDDLSLAAVAAGAADIVSVLSLLSSELGADDGLEDVMVTFGSRFHLIRHVRADSAQSAVLLVVLDRSRANLALARREIRDFCESIAS
ncbi:MAG: roadblock/LC7 domain-containing protein [Actinomycetota bacterium]|nr:roadblock/LC7 domain-containing protein [Actinomycetota bacterium]